MNGVQKQMNENTITRAATGLLLQTSAGSCFLILYDV